jgi:putative endonuclease
MFYVYLLASKPHGTLYAGVTTDLVKRVWEHKVKAKRTWKITLIESDNPHWLDRYNDLPV